MPIAVKEAIECSKYIAVQRLKRVKRYPLVLMLEPLYQCNLACAGCGETAPRANGRDLAPVATDSGGRIIWVNTHDPDQYRNWNEPLDRSRSGFFQPSR